MSRSSPLVQKWLTMEWGADLKICDKGCARQLLCCDAYLVSSFSGDLPICGMRWIWQLADEKACLSHKSHSYNLCVCDAMLCLQCVVMVCYACHISGFYNPTSLMWAEDLYSQDSPLARQLIQSIARQPHDRIMFGDLGGQLLGLVDISTWWSLFIHTI